MTTETSTLATTNKFAKQLHAGDQTVTGSITSALTQSAGIIFRLCPLPKGAVVTDVAMSGGDGECTMDVGVTEDDNIFIAALSVSAAMTPDLGGMNVAAGLGYTTLTPTYLIATMDAVSSAGTGGTYNFKVTYHMDTNVG